MIEASRRDEIVGPQNILLSCELVVRESSIIHKVEMHSSVSTGGNCD
jgi:hypothetical protein